MSAAVESALSTVSVALFTVTVPWIVREVAIADGHVSLAGSRSPQRDV